MDCKIVNWLEVVKVIDGEEHFALVAACTTHGQADRGNVNCTQEFMPGFGDVPTDAPLPANFNPMEAS